MTSDCINKICKIPLDFRHGDKSAWTLVQESGFESEYKNINIDDLKECIKRQHNLIDAWELWSMDKRTTGWYYLTLDNSPTIGAFDKNGKTKFKKTFDSALDACAEYIFREVSSIIGLE